MAGRIFLEGCEEVGLIDKYQDHPAKIWSRFVRLYLSYRYIRGNGIEIGALHLPLRVFNAAHVTYVDRKSAEELRRDYPEHLNRRMVNVDIVDDGEYLNNIGDIAYDFVIANHFLEHCEDPIGAIETFLRVLKPGGILFMAVPDKRYTFDRNREITTLEHLIKDHELGPCGSKEEHFREIEKLENRHIDRDYSIHYHVWTMKEIKELLTYMINVENKKIILHKMIDTSYEDIAIIKKVTN